MARVSVWRSAGQATVETVALLPVLTAVAFAVLQALAAGLAHELAGHAAEAGAVALVQGGDPVAEARAALPGWSRERLHVRVDGRRVVVAVEPLSPVRSLGRRLTARAAADAGPGVEP